MTSLDGNVRLPPQAAVSSTRRLALLFPLCSQVHLMSRVGLEQLTALALRTIEEATTEALKAPVKRTSGHALALAWLLHFVPHLPPPERWPFTNFWEALVVERDHDRQAAVTAAANAIYLTLGLTR